MKRVLIFLLCCEMLISCGERIKKNNANQEVLGSSDLTGDILAVKHCVECHAFPVPELLPKSIWKKEVLPSMGHRMGIYEGVNAIERILLVSKNLGIIGFFVDAKNEETKGYYEQFGFIPLPDNPLELFLPIATLQQAYESIVQK